MQIGLLGAQQPIWVDRTAGSPAANLGHEATLGMEGPHRMELMVGGKIRPADPAQL